MARPREFNPDEALSSAMNLFWRKGYFDTSVDELVKETGVNRKGLYTVFGSKHKLFLSSLLLYRKQIISMIMEPLDNINAGRDEISATFALAVSLATASKMGIGCLMCNSALEVAPVDAETQEILHSYFSFLAKQFQKALQNAQDSGQIDSSADIEKLANHLVGLLHTIPFFARSKAPTKFIKDTVEVGLEACGIKTQKVDEIMPV